MKEHYRLASGPVPRFILAQESERCSGLGTNAKFQSPRISSALLATRDIQSAMSAIQGLRSASPSATGVPPRRLYRRLVTRDGLLAIDVRCA